MKYEEKIKFAVLWFREIGVCGIVAVKVQC